jgi:hypothetical protein
MKWNKIKKESDIEKLLESYGGFHDSCLKDLYISTGDFVDNKMAMNFSGELTASLIFQRQYKTNTVIELKFEGVKQFNFKPEGSVIYDATLIMAEGYFYWADFKDWEIGDNDAIWINGKNLSWRIRPDLIGNINRINDRQNSQ